MNFIAAVDQQWGIGRNGSLLQPIPHDLKRFKSLTLNKVVVLGRKTLNTFPGGKPLPGRTNIILTRQEDFSAEGAIICRSFDELYNMLRSYSDEDIFIIGGGEIYNALIPYCRTGYITKIYKTYPADTFIIDLDQSPSWEVAATEGPYLYKDDIYYTFVEYRNKQVLSLP
ncbi:MAG TPA: dihydrofolate reductase [Clostridiales bacterium]|nr:dihydrofolate reductase [Clostridiales bacterium]